MTEIWNHLRCAASEVESGDVGLLKPLKDLIDRLTGHDLLTLGPSIDVTMHASEVAELANVELQNLRGRS